MYESWPISTMEPTETKVASIKKSPYTNTGDNHVNYLNCVCHGRTLTPCLGVTNAVVMASHVVMWIVWHDMLSYSVYDMSQGTIMEWQMDRWWHLAVATSWQCSIEQQIASQYVYTSVDIRTPYSISLEPSSDLATGGRRTARWNKIGLDRL